MLYIMIGVILFICIISGYCKGLIRSVVAAGAMVLSLFLTIYGYPYVSNWVQKYTKLDENIQAGIEKRLELETIQEDSARMKQIEVIDELQIPDVLKKALVDHNNEDMYTALGVKKFQEYVAGYLSSLIVNAIVFLSMELIVTVAVRVIIFLAKMVTDIPIVKGLDKTGGVILGLIESVLIIWTGFLGITVCQMTELGQTLMQQIAESPALHFLYNHNLLLEFVMNIANVLYR